MSFLDKYISGGWSGLSKKGRAIVLVVLICALFGAFYLALYFSEAFINVLDAFTDAVG